MLGEKPASRQRVSQWNADASRLEADELNVVMPSVVERCTGPKPLLLSIVGRLGVLMPEAEPSSTESPSSPMAPRGPTVPMC